MGWILDLRIHRLKLYVFLFMFGSTRGWMGTITKSSSKSLSFGGRSRSYHGYRRRHSSSQQQPQQKMALGDFSVELEKPFGLILEECEAGSSTCGVKVKEISDAGSAFVNGRIVPGDVLLKVEETDVSKSDFDSVMDALISSGGGSSSSNDEQPVVCLTFGDGLGQMDMPPNVVKTLKTTKDAFFIDSVVREAVREIRRNGKLGDLLNVEVIIGAGVRDNGTRGLARFFAIFSTDGGYSTYSCNVSATGVLLQQSNDDNKNYNNESGSSSNIKIVSLSCAKDEGLGQTVNLIQENVY